MTKKNRLLQAVILLTMTGAPVICHLASAAESAKVIGKITRNTGPARFWIAEFQKKDYLEGHREAFNHVLELSPDAEENRVFFLKALHDEDWLIRQQTIELFIKRQDFRSDVFNRVLDSLNYSFEPYREKYRSDHRGVEAWTPQKEINQLAKTAIGYLLQSDVDPLKLADRLIQYAEETPQMIYAVLDALASEKFKGVRPKVLVKVTRLLEDATEALRRAFANTPIHGFGKAPVRLSPSGYRKYSEGIRDVISVLCRRIENGKFGVDDRSKEVIQIARTYAHIEPKERGSPILVGQNPIMSGSLWKKPPMAENMNNEDGSLEVESESLEGVGPLRLFLSRCYERVTGFTGW